MIPLKMEAKRVEGGNRGLACPKCGCGIVCVTYGSPATSLRNRKYCPKCDKIWKFTMTLE